MFFGKLSAGTACVILGMLAGCAGAVPEYKEPPVATVDVRLDQARIVFRSAGMPMAVDFSVDSGTPPNERFTSIGRVFHSGREQLLPWIAALTEKTRAALSNEQFQLERIVEPERRILIRGISHWSGVNGQTTTTGSCGPIFSQFTPTAGKTYLLEFRFKGVSSCSQHIYEIGPGELRLPLLPDFPPS